MGYYDDMYSVERKQKSSGMGKYIITSVTSAIIGGLVVMLVSPMLNPTMPSSADAPAAYAMGSEQSSSPATVQPISINVETATVRAVEKVENAVVGITNIQNETDIWSRQTNTVSTGEGSGVIFKKQGNKAYIVTNYHVIDGAAKLEVSLPGGQKVDAKVVGYDQLTDMAVLEIDGQNVKQVAEFGDSKQLKVGEPAIAIGNPLGQKFSRTVTQGIISSTDRSMPIDINNDGQSDWEMDVLQTDAAINPGNSGGALVNIYGQVIGINTMKISREGVEGLGFAIPSNDVKRIIDQLMKDGYLKRGYMGVTPYDLSKVPRYAWKQELHLPDSVTSGVVIWDISGLSPASKAGLRQYDVITKIDNVDLASGAQLLKYLTLNKQPGDKVEITYYRDGIQKTTTVTLAAKPKN